MDVNSFDVPDTAASSQWTGHEMPVSMDDKSFDEGFVFDLPDTVTSPQWTVHEMPVSIDDNRFDVSVFDLSDAAASLPCPGHEMPISITTDTVPAIDERPHGGEGSISAPTAIQKVVLHGGPTEAGKQHDATSFEGHADRLRESSAPLHSPKDSGSGKPAHPDTEAENPKKSTADASLLADGSPGHTLPDDDPLEPQHSKHPEPAVTALVEAKSGMVAPKPEGDRPENLELQDPRMGCQPSCNEVQGAATLIPKNDQVSGVVAHGNISPTCSSPIRIDAAPGASDRVSSANGGLDDALQTETSQDVSHNTAEVASADKAATRNMLTCNGDGLEAATQGHDHDCEDGIVISSASISGNTEAADNEVATKDSLGDTADNGAGPEDAYMIPNETTIGDGSELSSAKDTTTPSPKTVAQSLKRKRSAGSTKCRRSKRPRAQANYTRYTDIEIGNIQRGLKSDIRELEIYIDKTWEASEEELKGWMQGIKEEFYKRAKELKDRQKAFADTLKLVGFQ